MTPTPLRIAVLGAARIAPAALARPALEAGHRLVAVAARDRRRAEEFAGRFGVERVHATYRDVLEDPEVEAVYNPLPNGLHGPWNLAALEAGKHVLSEKPYASDAQEAQEVRQAAEKHGLVAMEAFHHLYHPVHRRLCEVVASGEIGEVRHVECVVDGGCPPGDPRWSLELAGGALMDLGCYGLRTARELGAFAGGEPVLTAARAGERAGAPGVDEWLAADLAYPGGATVAVRCDMASGGGAMTCRVTGTAGEALAHDFVLPHHDNRLTVRSPSGERTEVLGDRPSYACQLDVFAAAVRDGLRPASDAADAVATMRLVDAAYRAAGLAPRPRTVLRAR